MEASIIIVSYNTCDLLRSCLTSIYKQTKDIAFEVIVIDNNSQDNSREMLKNEFPQVSLIVSRENLGFGKANNLGMAQATGKYLFLLNSDTLLLNNAVKQFCDYCEGTNERVGALGAILRGKDGNNVHSYGKFITLKSELKDLTAKYLRFLKDKEIHHPQDVPSPKEADYITGADLFVPHHVYEELGGFDPRFFMYCEEVDWQRRMMEAGYKRMIIPGPEIIHLEGGSSNVSSDSWSLNRIRNIHQSKDIYMGKYSTWYEYAAWKVAHTTLWIPLLLLRRDKIKNNIKLIINLLHKNGKS